MSAACLAPVPPSGAAEGTPFDLADESGYRRWRDGKLRLAPTRVEDLIVDVADPRALTPSEQQALRHVCSRANMAIYRSPITQADPALPRQLGLQLGLKHLDANWLADEDGVSSVTVKPAASDGEAYIPYTDRPIRWHTDGYYHPESRTIHGMILHCVRPAMVGGSNLLMDHELAYITLRDAQPEAIRALMASDAMTIPARHDAGNEVRAAQAGPVFSVDWRHRALHMRYTARTRSVLWRDDPSTQSAAAMLADLLERQSSFRFEIRLDPGMGLVGHNVLHARAGFTDDPGQPRLLYRARYLDRLGQAAPTPAGPP